MNQCVDNKEDRSIGYYWERQFCIMAYNYGKCFTPHQWDKNSSAMAFSNLNKYTLPDVTIWSCPGEHHEIKHKNPNKHNSIGLELYRYNALYEFKNITHQTVFYTIHNHDLSGGRYGKVNSINHWLCGSIGDIINLSNAKKFKGKTWLNGEAAIVDILYWDIELFCKLREIWEKSLVCNVTDDWN